MTAVTATRTWLRRMAAATPAAWQSDPVFRWAAIGAGIALAMLVLRMTTAPALHQTPPPSAASAKSASSPGTTASGSWMVPSPSPPMPKIAPERSLVGVTITPAPPSRFGTVPLPIGKPQP